MAQISCRQISYVISNLWLLQSQVELLVSSSFAEVLLELTGMLLTNHKFNQCIDYCVIIKAWVPSNLERECLGGTHIISKMVQEVFFWDALHVGVHWQVRVWKWCDPLAERGYQRDLFILKTSQHFVLRKYLWILTSDSAMFMDLMCIAPWLWNTDHFIKISSFIHFLKIL